MERIWTYGYDHAKGKWLLRSAEVLRRTEKYVFIDRKEAFENAVRISVRVACFSPEEALDRWVAAIEGAIKLKKRRIEHLKEGIEHARQLRELTSVQKG